ncbi:hypothetical protein EMIHUDRAFT_254524, partial [Emiliania huxleyi CCMP1516]|uniref:Uncharacterized protein n=2 Tax=Emiliania huxleyi TaxID=2903 RepID=A0A0D3JRD4_EMIH1
AQEPQQAQEPHLAQEPQPQAQEPPPAQEPLQAQGPSQAQQLPTLDRDQPPTQDRDRESQPQEAPQAQEPPQPQEAPQAQEPPQPQGAPPTQAPPQDANPAQLPSQIDINQIAAAIAAANAAATRIDREASAAAARAEREAMIAAFATASRTGHEEAMTDFATALRNALSNEGGATRGSLSAKVTRTYDADIPKLEGKNITPQMMAECYGPRMATHVMPLLFRSANSRATKGNDASLPYGHTGDFSLARACGSLADTTPLRYRCWADKTLRGLQEFLLADKKRVSAVPAKRRAARSSAAAEAEAAGAGSEVAARAKARALRTGRGERTGSGWSPSGVQVQAGAVE